MRLFLDDIEITLNPFCFRTLGEVIEEATRRASAAGRIVHMIKVDGKEISIDEEREMSARPVEEFESLHMRATTSEALLKEAIEGAVNLSEALCHDIRIVAASILENDTLCTKELFISYIESLGMFFNLTGAVFNGVRTGAFKLPESASGKSFKLPDPPTEIQGILQQFIEAWKAQDYPRVASILKDEISPHIEEWAAFFSAMNSRVD
ncbi:MAG: hypothetical protein FWH25_01920 [Syntrophorhabdaceae bacterium]|nr:hypothetical protein [Syntrophorhabdaceae bacterium]